MKKDQQIDHGSEASKMADRGKSTVRLWVRKN